MVDKDSVPLPEEEGATDPTPCPADGDGDKSQEQPEQEPEFILEMRYKPQSRELSWRVNPPGLDKVIIYGMLEMMKEAVAVQSRTPKKQKEPLILNPGESLKGFLNRFRGKKP